MLTRLPWLKRSVELEPANAGFWQSLAELFGEMEEFAEAIPCWERVIVLDPQRVQATPGTGLGFAGRGAYWTMRPATSAAPRSCSLIPEWHSSISEGCTKSWAK